MIFADLHQWMQYLALFSLAFLCLKALFSLCKFVYIYMCGSYPDFGKYGTWSVVTGGTDGIGRAHAQELAKCGQNIVLISRNPEKLKVTAKQLEEDFGIKTMIIVADFSQSDIYDGIKDKLENLDIGLLVNNVGASYSYPEYFVDIPNRSNFIDRLLAINLTSVAKMTDIVLPKMALKKKGIILNVSSSTADPPAPLMTVYTATKVFVDCFSKCLNYEYKDKGIIIQCVMPYFVLSKLTTRQASLMVPTPTTFVKSSLKTIGRTNRTYGYIMHAIQGMVFTSIPETVYKWYAFNMLNKVRKKHLEKMRMEKTK